MELITSPQFIIAICLFVSVLSLMWVPIELEMEDDDLDNDELF